MDVIKPRPDTKDYYGNLPLMYSIMQDDVQLIKKYFKKGREYFNLRNYKQETIFHIAAKFNSLSSLKEIVGRMVFVEELLKKDYKGDTCLHLAAKNGHVEILDYFLGHSTKSFLDIQNDFGFTVLEAL